MKTKCKACNEEIFPEESMFMYTDETGDVFCDMDCYYSRIDNMSLIEFVVYQARFVNLNESFIQR